MSACYLITPNERAETSRFILNVTKDGALKIKRNS